MSKDLILVRDLRDERLPVVSFELDRKRFFFCCWREIENFVRFRDK